MMLYTHILIYNDKHTKTSIYVSVTIVLRFFPKNIQSKNEPSIYFNVKKKVQTLSILGFYVSEHNTSYKIR